MSLPSSSSAEPSAMPVVAAHTPHPIFADHFLLRRIASHLHPATLTTNLSKVSRLFRTLFAPHNVTLALALSNLANLPTHFHSARLDWRSLGAAHTAAHLLRSRFAMHALYEICREAVPIRSPIRNTSKDFFPAAPCTSHRTLLLAAVSVIHRDLPDAVPVLVSWAIESLETLTCIGHVAMLRAVLEALISGAYPAPAPSWKIHARMQSAILAATTTGNADTLAMMLELRRRTRGNAEAWPDPWRMDWEDEAVADAPAPLTIPEPPMDAFEAAATAGRVDILAMLLSDTNTRATRLKVLQTGTGAAVIKLLMSQFSPADDLLELNKWVQMPMAANDADRHGFMAKVQCVLEDPRVVLGIPQLFRILRNAAEAGFREAVGYILLQCRQHGVLGDVLAIQGTGLGSVCFHHGAEDAAFLLDQPEFVVDDLAIAVAAEKGKLDVLKLLLAHPTVALRRAHHAHRIGILAAGKGFVDVVEHVIDAESVRPCHSDAVNAKSECLVMAAVVGRAPAVLEMLLQRHAAGEFACAHLRNDAWEQAFIGPDARCAKLLLPLQELERWDKENGKEEDPPVDPSLSDEHFLGRLHYNYRLPESCIVASLNAATRAGFTRLAWMLAEVLEMDPKYLQELLYAALDDGNYELLAILIEMFEDMLVDVDVNEVLQVREHKEANVRCASMLLDNAVLRSNVSIAKLTGAERFARPGILMPASLSFLAVKALIDRCKQDPAFFDPSDVGFLRRVFGHEMINSKRSFNSISKSFNREREDDSLEFLVRAVLEDPRVDPLFDDGMALKACHEGMRWRMLDVLLEHPKVKARYGDV
ncbi:hypothetical protein HDU96_010850 [Phlyctochytrium bullatum]|nr:hypothetical protein HDU96_010850 [Phlyctochytrium bullatum]